MIIWKLTVKESAGLIVQHFVHKRDAEQTYRTTYSKIAVGDRPRYAVEEVEVLDRDTHL